VREPELPRRLKRADHGSSRKRIELRLGALSRWARQGLSKVAQSSWEKPRHALDVRLEPIRVKA
jgi:hypothetical protein